MPQNNKEKRTAASTDSNKPLHKAIIQEDVALVIILLRNGADVDQSDHSGRTPLYTAAHRGNALITETLLLHGAAVNQPSTSEKTPLCIAALRGHQEVVKILLEYSANPNQPSGPEGLTPLHVAILMGRAKVVEILLNHGAEVDEVNTDAINTNFMYIAVRVRLAVTLGISPSASAFETIPRMQKEHPDAEKTLSTNAFDSIAPGATPLHVAARIGYPDVVTALLQHGAATDLTNDKGLTPLELATHYKNHEAEKKIVIHQLESYLRQLDEGTSSGLIASEAAFFDLSPSEEQNRAAAQALLDILLEPESQDSLSAAIESLPDVHRTTLSTGPLWKISASLQHPEEEDAPYNSCSIN